MRKRARHNRIEHGKHKQMSLKAVMHKDKGHTLKNETKIEHKTVNSVKKEVQAAIKQVKESRRSPLENRIDRIAMSNDLIGGLINKNEKKAEPKSEIDHVREFLKRETTKKKLFTNVAPGKEFFLANGGVVRNLHELSNAILYMDDHTFSYHVNGYKNDFSKWINDVFKDVELSQKLAASKDRGENAAIMFKHFFEKVK